MNTSENQVSDGNLIKAISELRKLFNCGDFEDKQSLNFENDGVFYIHKSNFSRNEVVEKLKDYFDKNMPLGTVVADIKPITLVHTKFIVFEY